LALKIAKRNGLSIPIIYNSSGYEKVETLKKLDGFIDIYLPDLKYYYDDLAKNLSGVNNYFEVATDAIKEMYNQVGNPVFDENGIIKKGLIIRHLVLPNHIQNTKQILKWINRKINKKVYISVMAQYFPEYKAMETKDLNRKLTKQEYDEVKEYINIVGISNGYIQELEENEHKYVPKWNK
jgi:putative pyruvate formate lyase activating enzyme